MMNQSTIICSNCGSDITVNTKVCVCGNSMSQSEKEVLVSKIKAINATEYIDNKLKIKAQNNFKNLDDYKLSGTYFIASSAKEDYEKKTNFIQESLIPSINEWRVSIQNADNNLAKDKVEVAGRVLGITEFVLREFFGPFKMKDAVLQEFENFRDFSVYELTEAMIDADIDLSDVKKTNFGTVSSEVLSSAFNTLETGTFSKMSESNSNWSKNDVKAVKTELAISAGVAIIGGITDMLAENSGAIKNVREADNELSSKIEQLSNVLNGLNINEKEIEKHKFALDKADIILDTCYNKILKPIVDELNNNQVYLEYRELRKPYDLVDKKIKIEQKILENEIKVSFWSCLLASKKRNFKKYWKKRISLSEMDEKYEEINGKVNALHPTDFKNYLTYHEDKTEEFKAFEKVKRKSLNKEIVIKENLNNIVKFSKVLKTTKQIITEEQDGKRQS